MRAKALMNWCFKDYNSQQNTPIGSWERHPITGGNWQGVGVQPDIAAPSDQALEIALQTLGSEYQVRG